MAKTRRAYTGGAVSTTTTSAINASGTTSFTITAGTGWPYGSDPFYVVVEPGTASEEKILVTRTGVSDTTINIASDSVRGLDGTAAVSHGSGVTVFPVFTAVDADEANELASKWTTKGDLVSYGSSTFEKLAVGSNDQVLIAASGEASGLKWGSVDTAQLAADAVTTAKIDDGAVTTAKISTTDYAGMGLVYVTGGTVSGTTTLSVDNCFTSAFDNYRIVFSRMSVSTAAGRAFRFRLRASGSDASGANYDYAFRGLTSGGASRDTNIAGSGFTEIGVYLDTYAATELGNSTVDIMSPAIAKYTYGLINANGWETAFFTRAGSFGHFLATAYDGFTVYLSSTGTMGFNWKVYGYNDG